MSIEFQPCALAIGNFDGVHLGHQALIKETIQYANTHNLEPSVLTFDPHPATVIAPERAPELICTLEDRLRLLEAYGIRQIEVLRFTKELAKTNPIGFVSQILYNKLKTKAVFVGKNFRFGHKAAGNIETLKALEGQFGFVSHFLDPVACRGQIISSSAIRNHLKRGNVSRAGRLLGRCFFIEGPVVSGHGVGAKQTVPTLNLRPNRGQLTPRGVYITETFDLVSMRTWPSITNVGIRPTFGGTDEVTIETYLLSPLEPSQPERIQVRFRRFVRHEQQFPTPEDLKAQILRDVARAQAYWRRFSRLSQPAPSIY